MGRIVLLSKRLMLTLWKISTPPSLSHAFSKLLDLTQKLLNCVLNIFLRQEFNFGGRLRANESNKLATASGRGLKYLMQNPAIQQPSSFHFIFKRVGVRKPSLLNLHG